MNTKFAFTYLILIGSFMAGCSKDKVEQATSLIITLKDESGNLVSNAPVNLYRSVDYYNPETVSTQTSGTDGTVTFTGLDESFFYSWLSTKDCLSNCSEIRHTYLHLASNKVNTATQILYPTALLELTNTSATNYILSCPILPDPSSLNGNASWSRYVKAGTYTIHSSATNSNEPPKDRVVTIGCGETVNLVYPF
jgi:hypothetical protein